MTEHKKPHRSGWMSRAVVLGAALALCSLAASPVSAQEAPVPSDSAPAAGPEAANGAAQSADSLATPANDPLIDPATSLPIDPATMPIDGALPPHDLSPWGMFVQADWVVKSVMIGLALASVITWTVWLAKSLELSAARRRTMRALRALQTSTSLGEAVTSVNTRDGAAAALVQAAAHEMRLSAGLDAAGIKERLTLVTDRIVHAAGRQAGRATGLLATIGATAPFVGLFGTVWGIMNSFIGISEAQTTNLAVVAPGIAEALLATAIGLAAAIPAVVIYNHFTRLIAAYRAQLGDAAAGVLQLVSRDLDRDPLRRAGELRRDAAE